MGMIIDGISASEHLDSSGEILEISGHDISDLEEGKGVLNWEHNNDSSEDILGSIIYAQKIMKRDDCKDNRQKKYWDSCGVPFVYIKAELYDTENHPGAVAAAAMIRYYHKNNLKILAGFSIEGSTLERSDNTLKRSVGRRVALTLRPCNKSAISGVLTDSADVKKYMNINAPINTRVIETDSIILEDMFKSSNPIDDLKKAIIDLNKTLTAGSYNVAPSNLVGGSALQVQDRNSSKKTVGLSQDAKKKLKGIVTKWDQKTPLRDAIKAAMPEVSDDYVDHFTSIAEDISLKKSTPIDDGNIRIDPRHSWNTNMNDDQKSLITGIKVNPKAPLYSNDSNRMHKTVNDRNDPVLVKIPSNSYGDLPDPSKTATSYYEMANNFFGLGDYVPVTNHFSHSGVTDSKHHIQAQKFMDGASTAFEDGSWTKNVNEAVASGQAQKMAIMDMITNGSVDRHLGNILTKNGAIIHIDNDDAFNYSTPSLTPGHFNPEEGGIGANTLHIDSVKWLNSLDPRKYVEQAKKSGLSRPQIMAGVQRLKELQSVSSSGKSLMDLHDMVNRKAV